MKQFTKKLLKRGLKENKSLRDWTEHNANRAEKKLNLPKKLYLELNFEFPKSKLNSDFRDKGNNSTLFMAGFLCGWAENNKKIK
jgi:hypothetical protein